MIEARAMKHFLDFEKPIAELESKIEELRHLTDDDEINIAEEVQKLEDKAQRLLTQTYAKLSPWQKTQVARHPERPHFFDYAKRLLDDFDVNATGPDVWAQPDSCMTRRESRSMKDWKRLTGPLPSQR